MWELIKDFGNISGWSPAVTKSEGTGGNGTGATRTITLKSGGELEEGLDYYSETEMNYLYRLSKEKIDVLPVSSYTAELKVDAGRGRRQQGELGRHASTAPTRATSRRPTRTTPPPSRR